MMQQPFDFDGKTYERQHDQVRLNAQLIRVAFVMRDGKWRTLSEIAGLTGDPEASISARLRDLRKERFGGSQVDRVRVGEYADGNWQYRVLLSSAARAAASGG